MIQKLVYRVKNWWFVVIKNYYVYLATGYTSRLLDYKREGYTSDDILKIAKEASERICADSGICASKNWWLAHLDAEKPTKLKEEFDQETRKRHEAITSLILDNLDKPVPPPVEGMTNPLSVEKAADSPKG